MGDWGDSASDYGSDSRSSSGGGGWKSAARAAGKSLSDSGSKEMDRASRMGISPVSYKRGGKVRKTGPANLHRGERVIPRGKVKKVERMMKKSKMRMKARR